MSSRTRWPRSRPSSHDVDDADTDSLQAQIAHWARLTGVAIGAEDRAGVATQLAALLVQAQLVMEWPLPEALEPASVFTA